MSKMVRTCKQITESKGFNSFIFLLIVLNVISIMLESVVRVKMQFENLLFYFDAFSVVIFTIEYIMRAIANKDRIIRHVFSFYALVDLIAILPFYLPFLIKVDLRFLRTLRLLRVFRIFKTAKYSHALEMLVKVIVEKRRELGITMFVATIFMLIAAFGVFYFEETAQPDKFSSLFDAVWWALATLTTVGYGDIYPITIGGKIIAGFLAILGIGIIAMPTGILASGIMEKIGKKQKYCPHCGKVIE